LDVLLPKEFRTLTPGFYMAFGNMPLSDESGSWLRLYWHMTGQGAVGLVRLLTQRLNGINVPFRLKVLNDIERTLRSDTAVLYINRADWPLVREVIPGVYEAISRAMLGSVPALTKRLAPGLGLAEDPGSGSSFGLNRCTVLAEGLLRSYEAGKRRLSDRLETVINCYAEANVSLETPYLVGLHKDEYSLPRSTGALADSSGPVPGKTTRVSNTDTSTDYRQEAITDICSILVGRVLWHAGMCNWIGPGVPTEHSTGASPARPVLSALGPDMYRGTSGIALFLGEAFALTGDKEVRRTCIGAINHALAYYETIPQSSRVGLYTGWVGIAVVASYLGRMLGEEGLLKAAGEIAQSLQAQGPAEEHDFLTGDAGVIVGLLILWKALDLECCLELALSMGDALLAAAVPDADGFSWRSPNIHSSRNLLGLSHGAAGIGLALMELYSVTNEDKFRQGAERAFAYERRWFDPQEGNWPDYRLGPEANRRVAATCAPKFEIAWCHGAPGIALSRVRAYQLTGNPVYRDEALIAMETTRQAISQTLNYPSWNLGLCHGLTGLAEVFSYKQLLPNQVKQDDLDLLERVGRYGFERLGGMTAFEPLAGKDMAVPGLMTGLAGFGMFYARLVNPSAFPGLSLKYWT
jgi:hypothetical protein